MKHTLERMLVLFVLILIVMLPIAIAENNTQDDMPPFIDAEIPSYVSSKTINIVGKTEPLSRVDLYVNGVLKRSSNRNDQGDFSFPSVELNPLAPNIVELKAEDNNGNTNEKSYTISVDNVKPKITATIPSTVDSRNVVIQGSVSEVSTIDFFVNNNPYSSVDNTTVFNANLGLQDGENTIRIKATDKAENTDEIERTVVSDTTPLKIIDLNPKQGAIFYEGFAQTDIEGKTKPGAKVELYLGDQKGDPEYETTADDLGYFRIEDVDLDQYSLYLPDIGVGGAQKIIGVSGDVGEGFEASYESVTPGAESLESDLGMVGDNKQDVTSIPLYFKLTYGDKSVVEETNYRIGTCFSGALDWSVQNMVEYQSPNMLSPERLSEGTELISSILKLDYVGSAPNASVKSISFEKLSCESPTIQNDETYSLACKILPNRPRYSKPNDDKTMWYLRYDLNSLDGQDNFSEDLWEDLTKQMTFLLRLKVHYTYLDERGVQKSDMQQVCVPMSYHLDKSRVDPRDVLPDWLQEEGLETINTTLTHLNDAIDVVEKVVKYAAIGCLAGFALKTMSIIYRRMMEWQNYLGDKVDPNKDDDEKCPIPLGNVKDYKEGDVTQQTLSDEELEERCPEAHSAWKSESDAYNIYRWTCDRFLCKGTPAKWTEDVDFDFIRTRVEENQICAETTGTEGTILKKVTDCKDICSGYEVCYEHKGEHYVYDANSAPVAKEAGGEKNYFELFPCGKSGEIQSNKKPLYVTVESGNAFLEETPYSTKQCEAICGEKEWANGDCMDWERAQSKLIRRYHDPESGEQKEIKDFEIVDKAKDCKEDERCYCYSTPKTELGREADPGEDWSYRMDKTGQVYYPKYRYYKGRDESACFGQNNFIQGEQDPYLNPSEVVPAFQCVCTTQVRNRLVAFRNILQGLYNCIYQIKTTGKADHGVCKELFTQYVCKWMYRVITWFMKGCAPWSGTGKEVGVGDYLQAGTQSIFGGVFESTGDILDDYDSPGLRNYLGVGQEAIANKVCLGALTGNWGFDIEGFVDAAYSTPYYTSAHAWPADREYLTWDPENYQSTYEYRIAWWMTPGCDISSYSVKLACINQDVLDTYDGARCEQAVSKSGDDTEINPANPGCDCYTLENEKTHTLFTGRRVSQGTFVNENARKVVKSPYRYDNIKLEVYMADAKSAEKCIPDANRVGNKGVFYYPISDATTYDIVACRFDQLTGQFVCNQGMALWQKRGRAYFGDIQCDNHECESSDDQAYYLGDDITLNPFQVVYSDKPQCAVIQVYNGHGKKLLGEEGTIIPLEVDDSEPFEAHEYKYPVPLKTVSIEDFATYNSGNRYSIDIPSELDAQQTDVLDMVKTGDVNMYIHEIGNSSYEYFLTRYDNESREHDISTTWQPLTLNSPVNMDGVMVNFFKVDVPSNADDCNGMGADARAKPCRRYQFKIRERVASSSVLRDQRWKIHVELRHAPGEENEGSCYESTSEDIITYQSVKQTKDFYVKAIPTATPSCVTDGDVCRSTCQYYVGGTKETASKYGCSAGKYCCETDIQQIAE